ncbi:DUF4365 domain-containing protein [Lysinibacillus xylanilyticus]|uniref:DUF4365 domain-containing protein n=1 Tax=Lysinibacillus xylanilyticus TaxID=582475 RepID=UPI00380E5459
MRSLNDQYNINEGKSIRFFEGVIEDYGWKYRRQEKDNDIDGEIEVFSEEGETTAKIIKVQLKATTNLEYKENSVTFSAPVKFLNFCDVCDIPTILVVYDVDQNRGFWLWTQQYISQTLDNFNARWRGNTSKVTIHIPLANEVLEEKKFYSELKHISDTGINMIQQLRKRDTSEYYFTILEEIDSSNTLHKRISSKIYIERSFATSRDSMIELIKKINQKIKDNYYDRGVWEGKENFSEPDYIWLYFYDDLIQFEYGLPFCRTEWVKGEENSPLLLKDSDNTQLIQENIRVSWEHNRPLNEYLIRNTTSKNDYLKQVLNTISFTLEELKILKVYFLKDDKSNFYNRISEKHKDYTSKYLLLGDILPPFECKTLHEELTDTLGDIDNLAIEINNGQDNEQYISNQYVSAFFSHMNTLNKEIKKLR